MKKIFLLAFSLIFLTNLSYANEEQLKKENLIQTRIDKVGTKLLNLNKIPKSVVFVYDKSQKKEFRLMDKTLSKRQFVMYDGLYQFIQSDDELAAVLAREIVLAQKSYHGIWGGRLDSLQVTLSPKKFETMADKRAVDYMVTAGYNPLALIVFINKFYPQSKTDFISKHNLTSKRLARVYEYIYCKYPEYLENNEYINNEYYQNFLLTSIENRKMLAEKIRTNSCEECDYE